MKLLIFPFVCMIAVACGNQTNTQALTDRQKLDSVKMGMSMEDVLNIYGLKDTLNRSSWGGTCGGELDSLTGEVKGGEPLYAVTMNDTTTLAFCKGKLMLKPDFTWEETKKDTSLMRIINSLPPEK